MILLSGDISYQLFVKERQKCKPFSYFMEVVAPDMLDRYPYEEPPEFASGAIESLADNHFCIDTMNRPKDQPIGKYFCISITKLEHWIIGFIDFRCLLLCSGQSSTTRQPTFYITILSRHRNSKHARLFRQLRRW